MQAQYGNQAVQAYAAGDGGPIRSGDALASARGNMSFQEAIDAEAKGEFDGPPTTYWEMPVNERGEAPSAPTIQTSKETTPPQQMGDATEGQQEGDVEGAAAPAAASAEEGLGGEVAADGTETGAAVSSALPSQDPAGDAGVTPSAAAAVDGAAPVANVRAAGTVAFAQVDLKGVPEEEADRIRADRERAGTLVSGFLSSAAGRVSALTASGPELTGGIDTAVTSARAAVDAAIASEKATVTAHFDGLISAAQASADSLRSTIGVAFDGALTAVDAAAATAKSEIQAGVTSSLANVGTMESAQLIKVDQLYAQANTAYQAAGQAAASGARSKAATMARNYEARVTGERDSLLDGYLTDRRWRARGKAAREVGKQYADALREEATRLAAEAAANIGQDKQIVRDTAKGGRDAISAYQTALLQQVDTAATQVRSQVEQARADNLAAVASALTSATGQMRGARDQQLGAIDAQGAQILQGVEQQGKGARESVSKALSAAVNKVQAGLEEIRGALTGAAPPTSDVVAAKLAEAEAELAGQLQMVRGQLSSHAASAAAQIGSSAQAGITGLQSTGEAARSAGDALAAQVETSFTQLGTAASQTATQLQAGFTQQMTQLGAGAKAAIKQVEDAVQQGYASLSQRLTEGAQRNSAALRTELLSVVDTQMAAKVREEAEKAAAKEQPAWKSVVMWALIIIVVVLVAVFLGPLVIGAIGGAAAAMGASAAAAGAIGAIVGGALVGGATGGVVQVISNWGHGEDLGNGVGQAMLVGAIGGMVGGAAGVGLNAAGAGAATSFGVGVGVDVAYDTVVNAITGSLTWENFAKGLITSLIMQGSGNVRAIKDIQVNMGNRGARFGQNAVNTFRPNADVGPTGIAPETGTPPSTETPTVQAEAPSNQVAPETGPTPTAEVTPPKAAAVEAGGSPPPSADGPSTTPKSKAPSTDGQGPQQRALSPEQKLLPAPPEQKLLPAPPEQKLLPPGPTSPEFSPQGIDVDPMASPQGRQLMADLAAADPMASPEKIISRARSQLRTGVDLPTITTADADTRMTKLVRQGQEPSGHSPFWMDDTQLTGLNKNPNKMGDQLGLPEASLASDYDVYAISPAEGQTPRVYNAEIAPVTENGKYRSGGGRQGLIPNRSQWKPPELVGTMAEGQGFKTMSEATTSQLNQRWAGRRVRVNVDDGAGGVKVSQRTVRSFEADGVVVSNGRGDLKVPWSEVVNQSLRQMGENLQRYTVKETRSGNGARTTEESE